MCSLPHCSLWVVCWDIKRAEASRRGHQLAPHSTSTHMAALRKIGNTIVSAIGYGTMPLSASYGTKLDGEERFKVHIPTLEDCQILF